MRYFKSIIPIKHFIGIFDYENIYYFQMEEDYILIGWASSPHSKIRNEISKQEYFNKKKLSLIQ